MRKSVSGLYREIEDAQIQFRFGLQCHGCPVLRSSDENPNDGEYFFSWAYLTFFMLSRWGSKCKVASESFLHVPRSFGPLSPSRIRTVTCLFPSDYRSILFAGRDVTFKPNRRIFKRSTPRSLQHDLKNRYQVCLAAYLSRSLGFSAVHEVSSCCNHLFKTITSKQFTRNACLTSRNPFPQATPLTFEDILPAREFPAFHSSRISLPPRRRAYQRWLIRKSSFLFGIGLETIKLANDRERRTHNKVRVRAAVPPGQGGPALTESTRDTT